MNKKIFSAALFGALMALSAGTFTSCKDYDDDINGLQEQIDGLDAALDALEAKVKDGKWITSVTPMENGFTIVLSDGSSYPIENGKNGEPGTPGTPGAAGKDGTIVEVKEGYWWLNGEKSPYVAVTADDITGKVHVPEIRDGYWYFYNEETKSMEKSEYKAAGAAYAVYANGKYTLYMPDANGDMLSEGIELPTAASMITAVTFTNDNAKSLYVYKTNWSFNSSVASIATSSAWNGTKALPSNNTKIYGAKSPVEIQVHPAEIDVVEENIKFSLVNSKNETTLAQFVLTAESYDGYIQPNGVRTRAIANGLYDIVMKPQTISDANSTAIDNALVAAGPSTPVGAGRIGYALNVGDGCRTAYNITVAGNSAAPTLRTLELNGVTANIGATGTVNDIMVGQPYEVTFNEDAAVYDAYFTVPAQYRDAFGIVINNEKRTITVGKNPDASTIGTYFPMTVYTADINGAIKETTLTVNLSTVISGVQTLAAQTVPVNTATNFNFALSDVTVSSTDAWKLNVALGNTAYTLYKDAACTQAVGGTDPFAAASQLFKPEFVAALNSTSATTDVNSAKYLRFNIDNNKAATIGLSLNTTYYVQVTFKDSEATPNILNKVVVPVKFTAPALSTLFTVKAGYVKDEVINAYFYQTTGTTMKNVALATYFSKSVADATVALDNTTNVASTNKTSNGLANLTTTAFGTSELAFDAAAGNKPAPNAQFELGYGETLTVNVSKDNYKGWKYTTDAEKAYTFKVRMMSSIVEGSVKGANGNPIIISANDATNGADITSSMIKGYDYNNNEYNVVPDEYDATGAAWKNVFIKMVSAAPDADGYIKDVETVAATQKNGVTTNGSFKVTANSLSTTQTVKMPVTVEDIWGYKLIEKVDVTIKVGE